jgi:hypothetical protein
MPTLYASPLFHSGRQSTNGRSESKATVRTDAKSVHKVHFDP